MQTVLSPRSVRRVRSDRPGSGARIGGAARTSVQFVRQSLSESPAWMRRTLLAAVFALVLTTAFCGYQSHGTVMNGVVVAGVPLGGLSYAEARSVLDGRAAQIEAQRVTITFQGNMWQPTLAELGVALDTESAWSAVAGFGSARYLLERIMRSAHLRSSAIVLGTPLRIDRQALEAYCAERMKELGLAPVNAELKVDGESILVTQDVSGVVISVDRLQQDLVRELAGFTEPTIDLMGSEAPAPVRASQIEPEVAALASVLEQPLRLYTATDQWEIPAGQIAPHIKLDQSNGRPSVVVDEEAIAGLVDQIADELDQPLREASVDESGLYARIISPADGVRVDRDELNLRIHQAIAAGRNEVEIPVTVTPVSADIRSLLTEYGVTDLIATGSSSYAGSEPGRATNVRRAAELIDGTLVGAGDSFSFNQALGSITEAGGFVPAGASEGGIPGTSVGGGVCQVSTSIFRAALVAGLPITEWYPHAYRSLYYEQDGWAPGFDASIQQPDDDPLNGPDLKFKNVTEGWLLIRATATSAGELKVSLFGQAPGFDVWVSDPVYGQIVPADQTPVEEVNDALPPGTVDLWQPARDGVTMIVYRTVYAADGTVIIDEEFVSTYLPQGPVYRVSADMAGSTDAG